MLKPLLEEFLRVESVSAAVVIGRDGFVIESAVSGKIDIEALGAMASTGLGTSEAMGTTLGRGNLYQMLVELEKGPILLSPLSINQYFEEQKQIGWGVDARSCSLVLAYAPARFTSPPLFLWLIVGTMTPLACHDAPAPATVPARTSFNANWLDVQPESNSSISSQVYLILPQEIPLLTNPPIGA